MKELPARMQQMIRKRLPIEEATKRYLKMQGIDIDNEYKLIQDKKSRLSATMRMVVRYGYQAKAKQEA